MAITDTDITLNSGFRVDHTTGKLRVDLDSMDLERLREIIREEIRAVTAKFKREDLHEGFANMVLGEWQQMSAEYARLNRHIMGLKGGIDGDSSIDAAHEAITELYVKIKDLEDILSNPTELLARSIEGFRINEGK